MFQTFIFYSWLTRRFPLLALPQSTKSQTNLNQVSEMEMSGVRRSYTQELLDFGITFGAQSLETNHQTNPFITPASGNLCLMCLRVCVLVFNWNCNLIKDDLCFSSHQQFFWCRWHWRHVQKPSPAKSCQYVPVGQQGER